MHICAILVYFIGNLGQSPFTPARLDRESDGLVGPVTLERVIKPFGPQWCIVGDEQQHRFLQPLQVVAARARESFLVFEKGLGVVARLGRRCPFTACGLLRGH